MCLFYTIPNLHIQVLLVRIRHMTTLIVLHFGSTSPVIRMYILMLDTRDVEQTKDVRMYT